jgi:hypothetical protein
MRGIISAALLLLPLLTLAQAPDKKVQQNGVAIWELPTAKLNALLTAVPPTDAARYDRLRQTFIDFGCTGNALTEPPIDKKGHRRNLICTLPGEDKQAIIVSAWYPDRPIYSGGSRGWPEAVMLPILYNALAAQPRHFTFIFAEFEGAEGEYEFFRTPRLPNTPQPLALVALSALALSPPHFFMPSPQYMPSKYRTNANTVFNAAFLIAQLQGFSAGQAYLPLDAFSNSTVSANPPLGDPKDLPRILIFSTDSDKVSLNNFQQAHDFIAFLLGTLDIRFNPLTPASAEPQ